MDSKTTQALKLITHESFMQIPEIAYVNHIRLDIWVKYCEL